MAERFGVSPLSVAKRERGESTPAIIQCREICVHYEISPPALGAEYLRRNQQGRNRPRKGDSGRILFRAVMIALVRGLSFYQRQHFLKFDRRVVDSFRRNTEMMRTVILIGGIGVNMSENISVGHVAAHIERVM